MVEGDAKLRGAKNPPIINKARFKFLGLNLDYSIEKARRVLGYQPPFTFEQGIERAMAEHRPPASRRQPRSPRRREIPDDSYSERRNNRRDIMSNVKGKRVAVLVEKFYEDLELWYPVLRLREAGCDVKIVGPKAGETYASKHGYPPSPTSPPARSRRRTSTRSSSPAATRPTTCAGIRRWSTWSPRPRS